MNIKKIAIPIVALGCINLSSITASAHNADVFPGSYTGTTVANFVLRINSTAQNDIFTYSNVFQYGCDWNEYSSNVQLGVAMAGPGTPTIANQVNVDGVDFSSERSITVTGRTIPYDSNGKPCYSFNDWSICKIEINISDSMLEDYRTSENGIAKARKMFVHEVGHVLKLAHPEKDSSLSGHIYSGYPSAIMNQGSPGTSDHISDTITNHDISCLITKWGA